MSHQLSFRAQTHLFHDVQLQGSRSNAIWQHDRAATACIRLCEILHSSPHLIQFIRYISIPFALDIISQVSHIRLSHIQTMCITGHWIQAHGNSPDSIDLLQGLIVMKSIRQLKVNLTQSRNTSTPPISRLLLAPSPTITALHIHGGRFEPPHIPGVIPRNSHRPSITDLHLRTCQDVAA